MFTVTKAYRDYPASHRQPTHDGHCRLIHGHNWGWDITLSCLSLDKNGFVLDVGKMGAVKEFLRQSFDHTLLLNEDDPLLKDSRAKDILYEYASVVVVPNCGMEGLAQYVFNEVGKLLTREFPECVANRGLYVDSVTCWEDSKNSAFYRMG